MLITFLIFLWEHGKKKIPKEKCKQDLNPFTYAAGPKVLIFGSLLY